MYKPQAFKQIKRKARKQHKCCECSTVINKRDTYSFSSGIWDSTPESFKQCNSCASIFKTANDFALKYGYEDEARPSFLNLKLWVHVFVANEGDEFISQFNIPDTCFWRDILDKKNGQI